MPRRPRTLALHAAAPTTTVAWALLVLALTLAYLVAPAPAAAQGTPAPTWELTVGGGPRWLSDMPERTNLETGAEIDAWTRLNLDFVKLEGSFRMLDPSRPQDFQVQGAGRLLFIQIQDFTYRQTSAGELLRGLAGFGGEIGLPANFGSVEIGAGAALTRLGGPNRIASEAYGVYGAVNVHLRIGPVVNDLRVAVHALTPPPDLLAAESFGPELLLENLAVGVTASNRFYWQALQVGPIGFGPQLVLQWEDLVEGRVLFGTVGIAGDVGL